MEIGGYGNVKWGDSIEKVEKTYGQIKHIPPKTKTRPSVAKPRIILESDSDSVKASKRLEKLSYEHDQLMRRLYPPSPYPYGTSLYDSLYMQPGISKELITRAFGFKAGSLTYVRADYSIPDSKFPLFLEKFEKKHGKHDLKKNIGDTWGNILSYLDDKQMASKLLWIKKNTSIAMYHDNTTISTHYSYIPNFRNTYLEKKKEEEKDAKTIYLKDKDI